MLAVANPPAAPCRQSVHRDSHHPSCLYFPRAASRIYPARKLEWHRLLPPKVETLPNFSFDSPLSRTPPPCFLARSVQSLENMIVKFFPGSKDIKGGRKDMRRKDCLAEHGRLSALRVATEETPT